MWWRFASELASLNTGDHAMCPPVTHTCSRACSGYTNHGSCGIAAESRWSSALHTCAPLLPRNTSTIMSVQSAVWKDLGKCRAVFGPALMHTSAKEMLKEASDDVQPDSTCAPILTITRDCPSDV